MLFNGIDAIRPIPEKSHWKLADYFNSDPACPDHTYCSRGGFIPEIAFDPLSYGIPPNNLQATDTSQLLGLEVAKTALEDAGYAPGTAQLERLKVNVILGVTGTQELVIPLGARLGHPYWKQALEDAGVPPEVRRDVMDRIETSYVQWQENSFPGLLGNVVAGRIANRLNLSGTNAVSDAACASSLSAVHTAVMELQSGRCDMSITGWCGYAQRYLHAYVFFKDRGPIPYQRRQTLFQGCRRHRTGRGDRHAGPQAPERCAKG